MDSTSNPYAAPADVSNIGQPSETSLKSLAIEMARTRPWIIGFSALLFVVAVFVPLIALLILSQITHQSDSTTMTTGVIAWGVFALVFLVAGSILTNVQRQMHRFVNDQTERNLEIAIAAQNGFWMYVGTTAAIIAVMNVLGTAMQVNSLLR